MRGGNVSDNSVCGLRSRQRLLRASEEANRIHSYLGNIQGRIDGPSDDRRTREHGGSFGDFSERDHGYTIYHAHPVLTQDCRRQLATPFLLLLLYLWKTDQLDLNRFWEQELVVPDFLRQDFQRAKVVSECEAVNRRVYYHGSDTSQIWRSWRNDHVLRDGYGNILYRDDDQAEYWRDSYEPIPYHASFPFTNHTRFSPPPALGGKAFLWLKVQFAYTSIFNAFRRVLFQEGGLLFGDDALFEALTGRTGCDPFVGSAVAKENPFTLGEGSGFKILTDYADRCFVLERQVNRGRYIMGRSVVAGAVATIGGLIATKFVAAAVVLSCLTPVGWGLAAVFCVGLLIRAVANFKMHQENQKLKQEIELRNTGGMCGLFPPLPKGESVPKTFPEMAKIEGRSEEVRLSGHRKKQASLEIGEHKAKEKELREEVVKLYQSCAKYKLDEQRGTGSFLGRAVLGEVTMESDDPKVQENKKKIDRLKKEIERRSEKIKALSAEVEELETKIKQAEEGLSVEQQAAPVLKVLGFYAQHLRKGYQPGLADEDHTNGTGRESESAPDPSRISLNSQ